MKKILAICLVLIILFFVNIKYDLEIGFFIIIAFVTTLTFNNLKSPSKND